MRKPKHQKKEPRIGLKLGKSEVQSCETPTPKKPRKDYLMESSHVQLIWLSFINMLERMLDEQNLEPFFIAHKNLRAPTWAYQKWINMIYLIEEHFILLIISVPSVFQKLQIIFKQLPFRAISGD